MERNVHQWSIITLKLNFYTFCLLQQSYELLYRVGTGSSHAKHLDSDELMPVA